MNRGDPRTVWARYRPSFGRAHRIDAATVVAVLVPLYLKLLWLPPTVGNDSQTHAYKVSVVLSHLAHGVSLPRAGIYDWSWYAGYGFLQLYSPLFYGLAGVLSGLGFSPLSASHIVATGSYGVGAVAIYALTRRYTAGRLPATLATATYVYFPTHVTAYLQSGGLPRVLAVGIAPVALYLMVVYLDGGRQSAFVAWTLAGTGVIVANLGVGFVFTLATVLWLAVRGRWLLSLCYGGYVTLLSLFLLVPYATYEVPNSLPVVLPEVTPGATVADLATGQIGAALVVVVVFVAIVPTALRRSNGREDDRLVPTVSVIGAFVVYNAVAFTVDSSILQVAAYGRSTPVFVTFGSLALGLALDRMEMNTARRALVLGAVVLLVLEAVAIAAYSPLQPDRYDRAYDAIDADSDRWSRWIQLPREPVGAFATDEVGKPTISGWYVQGMHRRLYRVLGSTMNSRFIVLERDIAYGDPERAVDRLEYLGVEYVVVERIDPPLGVHLSLGIARSLQGVDRLSVVERYDSVTVYRIENYSVLEGYRTRPGSPEAHLQSDVRVPLETVRQTPLTRTFVFETDRPRWVVLPVAHTDSLSLSVDGTAAEPSTAYGGMTLVHVDAGRHRATARPIVPTRTVLAALVSMGALVVLVLVGDKPVVVARRVLTGSRR